MSKLTASEIIHFVEPLNISVTLVAGVLSCDFSQSCANDDNFYLNLIQENKAEITTYLHQQAVNDPNYTPDLPTNPPDEYKDALMLLSDLIDQNGYKPVWRKDWRLAMMRYFGCNQWDAKGLEQDIRGDKWVVFYEFYQYVELTTPLDEWLKGVR